MRSFSKRRVVLTGLILFVAVLVGGGCAPKPPKEWGKMLKYKGSTLFYTSKVSEAEAKKFGDYLLRTGFFQEKNPGTIQLTREDNVYQFRTVVKKEAIDDMEYIKIAGIFAAHISKDVFNGGKVEIHLCNNKFETLRTVTYEITPGAEAKPAETAE